MKDTKIIGAYNEIQPDEYAKQRVLNRVMEPKRKRRLIPATAGIAAVLVIAVVINSFMPAEIAETFNNSFNVRVYAFEQQADGTIVQREVNLADQGFAWGGYYEDGQTFINVNLDVEGENIKHVEFSTASGQFAKQYHSLQPGQMIINTETMGLFVAVDEYGNHRIAVYGSEFEKLGNKISFDEVKTENILLFVVIESDHRTIPDYIEIQVDVTFNDGETQSKTLIINLADRMGLALGQFPFDDIHWPELSSINVEYLTLIPESVTVMQPYVDTYERWDGMQMYTWYHGHWESFHSREFVEEDGGVSIVSVWRSNSGENWRRDLIDGGFIGIFDVDRDFVFIVEVVKIVDGEMVGMKYIMTAEMGYELGFR